MYIRYHILQNYLIPDRISIILGCLLWYGQPRRLALNGGMSFHGPKRAHFFLTSAFFYLPRACLSTRIHLMLSLLPASSQYKSAANAAFCAFQFMEIWQQMLDHLYLL